MTSIDTSSANEPAPEIPIFAASAPAVMADRNTVSALFAGVMSQLASAVEVDAAMLDRPTPCSQFTVGELQRHVLGWLQFFAAALADPTGADKRIDPDSWNLGTDESPATIVGAAGADIERAIRDLPDGELVVMAQARMSKEAVLAMALGEYLVHGWDLSVSTGRRWEPAEDAAVPALEFLQGTVVPEYRGPDTGFFDAEVAAHEDASAFEQLLCFAGRNPYNHRS